MKRVPLAGPFVWPVVLAAVAAALITTAVAFRRTATAQTVPPSPHRAQVSAGVVCFGTVDLEHGVTALYPLQPGRVTEVLVHENQSVEEGTELLRLDDRAARSRLGEADAALEVSRIQLREARKLPDQHRRQVDQQKAVLEAAHARLTAAREVVVQRQKLAQPAFVATVDTFASEIQVRQLEALDRAETQRLAELQARDVDAEIRRAEYEQKAAEARREQAKLALDDCRITAPRAGTVLRLHAGPGDLLGAERGQPAVLFAADGPQVVRATVEQEFAARVKEGERALVEDEANPTLSWRGKVQRVAGWYSQRRTFLHDPTELSDVRTLECVIVLEPGQQRLLLGQGVRVFIGALPLEP